MTANHTSGPWRAVALGGASVVLTTVKPARNDLRIPAFGYDESRGYSVGYPFIDDVKGVRLDFVCFSHADAHVIAAGPDLLAALEQLVVDAVIAQGNMRDAAKRDLRWEGCAEAIQPRIDAARAAIAKAKGEQQ